MIHDLDKDILFIPVATSSKIDKVVGESSVEVTNKETDGCRINQFITYLSIIV